MMMSRTAPKQPTMVAAAVGMDTPAASIKKKKKEDYQHGVLQTRTCSMEVATFSSHRGQTSSQAASDSGSSSGH